MKSNSSAKPLLVVIALSLVVVALICLVTWRMFWVTKVDNYELAFNYNWLSGQIERFERTGWVTRTPIINSVHTIDLRPYQISITADIQRNIDGRQSNLGARVLNAKLVRFNPEGLNKFIEWHGRGAGDKTSEMLEILKAYAFNASGGKDCPFLTIVDELSPKPPATNAMVVR